MHYEQSPQFYTAIFSTTEKEFANILLEVLEHKLFLKGSSLIKIRIGDYFNNLSQSKTLKTTFRTITIKGIKHRVIKNSGGLIIDNKTNKPIGCVLNFRFQNMIYIKPEYRKKGLGKFLLSKVLEVNNYPKGLLLNFSENKKLKEKLLKPLGLRITGK